MQSNKCIRNISSFSFFSLFFRGGVGVGGGGWVGEVKVYMYFAGCI